MGQVVEHHDLVVRAGRPNWRRFSPYRSAIASAVWVARAAPPATLTRPRTSVPSIVKNRRDRLSIGLEYVPSAATSPYRLSSASRGTRTWSKLSRPLSTPLSPALWPQSSIRTPGTAARRRPDRHQQRVHAVLSPPVTSWANTTASRPSRAALPM